MSGGIAILLLLIALVAIGAVVVSLYGTGGVLCWRKTDPRADRAEHTDEDEAPRPRHSEPTTPAQEHTDFAGRGETKRR